MVGFWARGSLMLLEPPAARADSPDAGALWLCTRRRSSVELSVEEAADRSLVGVSALSSRECCCCQAGKADEKVVVELDSCVVDVVEVTPD